MEENMNSLNEKLDFTELLHAEIPNVSREQWVAACNIIIDKPQSLDKRVAGQILLGEEEMTVKPDIDFLNEVSTSSSISWDTLASLIKATKNRNSPKDNGGSKVTYRLQRMISRNEKKFKEFQRIVIISEFSVIFVPIEEDSVAYGILYSGGTLYLSTSTGLKDRQLAWLKTRLMPRFSGWIQDTLTTSQGSLNLIQLDKYCKEYSRLKEVYADELVRNWAESSDPEKSVHEDIGIAAYLACLWGNRKVSFVDLGCGNGLLVYILSSEGHRGVGYDLRRRGIWDWFPVKLDLREQAVTPGLDTRFPDVDWILGNHSDELTPWIPVFAALSGPSTCYWVLPCCPFDFTAKYQRRNAADSVFRDYLNFVTEVGGTSGFCVKEDRMRIPSTKRICLVGEPVVNEVYEERKARVQEFVREKMEGFTPREKVERVRNCTKIGNDIISSIVNFVVEICLEVTNLLEKETKVPIKEAVEPSTEDILEPGAKETERIGNTWNAGGEHSILSVVQKLQQRGIDFSRLKAECGGLQTLLRNNHSIFQVQQGKVKLRIPGTKELKVKNPKMKSRDCWFHLHHPDGCLLDDQSCTWIHS